MIPGKTLSQIQSHFENFYVDGANTAAEPALQRRPPAIIRRSDLFVPSPCPLALIAPLENPPRPPVRPRVPSTSSIGGGGWLSKELPDYYPARGEFGVEYDNAAERDMELIAGDPAFEEALLLTSRRERDGKLENGSTDEVAGLITELAVAMVERYNRRLRRRAAVRRLIREHGLISRRRVHAAAGRLQGVKCAGWGRSAHQWRAVCRLVVSGGGAAMDRLMEALLLEADIKCNILNLQKLRTDGEWFYVSFLCSWVTSVRVLTDELNTFLHEISHILEARRIISVVGG
jgi:hypothetical protein